jgi:hypothetical protein
MAKLNSARINRSTGGSPCRQCRSVQRAPTKGRNTLAIKELQAAGITNLNGIAAALNERGARAPAGHRHWHAAQVARLLRRLTP